MGPKEAYPREKRPQHHVLPGNKIFQEENKGLGTRKGEGKGVTGGGCETRRNLERKVRGKDIPIANKGHLLRGGEEKPRLGYRKRRRGGPHPVFWGKAIALSRDGEKKRDRGGTRALEKKKRKAAKPSFFKG